jgi:hypothetical protein
MSGSGRPQYGEAAAAYIYGSRPQQYRQPPPRQPSPEQQQQQQQYSRRQPQTPVRGARPHADYGPGGGATFSPLARRPDHGAVAHDASAATGFGPVHEARAQARGPAAGKAAAATKVAAPAGGEQDSGWLAERPWIILVGLVIVFGIVLGSVGGACLDDTLVGVHNCSKTPAIIMIVVGSTSAGVCIVGLVIWWLVHSPEITREHGDVLGTAFIFVSVGLVCGSVGTACLNDTLAGVDDCEHSVGWPLFFVGWSLTVLVILGVLFLVFPQYRARVWLFSFGVFAFTTQCVGGACIDDNLVGIDGCDDLLGQIVVAVGSGFMALILIISAAMYYDRWEGQKLLISIPSALGIVGVALGSFGWSCLVDTLAGAKPCEQATGWVLTIIGWGMVRALLLSSVWAAACWSSPWSPA